MSETRFTHACDGNHKPFLGVPGVMFSEFMRKRLLQLQGPPCHSIRPRATSSTAASSWR